MLLQEEYQNAEGLVPQGREAPGASALGVAGSGSMAIGDPGLVRWGWGEGGGDRPGNTFRIRNGQELNAKA